MGGYYIQTLIFPDMKSLILSLPFGFFTTAVLYSNEIPDYPDDISVGKKTWVSIVGSGKAYILYCLLISFGFLSVVLNIIFGNLSLLSLATFIFIFPVLKAVNILKKSYQNKRELMLSSKITIAVGALVGVILVLDIIL